MKSIRTTILILTFVFVGLAGGAKAYTQVGFSLDFHDALAPYGSWVHVSACSDCWRPSVAGFVSLHHGHWVYTSYGPTWEADEAWGWAPYHYGHWIYTVEEGWLWVPGYEWAPARVSWAYGNDYVGWSPIYNAPPRDPNVWIFVGSNNFVGGNYGRVRLQRDAVRTLFDRRVVRTTTRPLARTQVERIVHRRISVVPVRANVVEINHHKTRLIVPANHEKVVMEHVARVAHRAPERASGEHRSSSVHNAATRTKFEHGQEKQVVRRENSTHTTEKHVIHQNSSSVHHEMKTTNRGSSSSHQAGTVHHTSANSHHDSRSFQPTGGSHYSKPVVHGNPKVEHESAHRPSVNPAQTHHETQRPEVKRQSEAPRQQASKSKVHETKHSKPSSKKPPHR